MYKSWQLSLTITLVALGILLSIQFRTQQEAIKELVAQRQEDLAVVYSNLEQKNGNLTRELWELRAQLQSLESDNVQGKDVLTSLQNDLQRLNGSTGVAGLRGSGIIIEIPIQTPVTAEELISIVNELWNIGAEGISINKNRLAYFTPISEDDTTLQIKVGPQRLSYPLTIEALGDSDKLHTGISIAGGTVDLLKVEGVIISIAKAEDLILPPIDRKPNLKLSRPITQEEIAALENKNKVPQVPINQP